MASSDGQSTSKSHDASMNGLRRAAWLGGLVIACFGACTAPWRGAATTTPASSPGLSLLTPAGSRVTLASLYQTRDALVLVFWSSSCPCVRRYQGRVDALLERYPAQRVRVLGVSSNAGETLAEAIRVARERGVRIPLWRDEGGALARTVGARSTPTVVVLDRRGRVRFRGWLDNERGPGEPGREPWLDQALHGVLGGHDRFATRTPTYGCLITRSVFQEPASTCCAAATRHPCPERSRSPETTRKEVDPK